MRIVKGIRYLIVILATLGVLSSQGKVIDTDSIQQALRGLPIDQQLSILSEQVYELAKEGKNDQALLIAQQELTLAKEKGQPKMQADAYKDLGKIYKVRKEYRSAYVQFKEAYHLYKQYGRAAEVKGIIRSLTEVSEALEAYDLAVPYLQRAAQLAEAREEMPELAGIRHQIGQMYQKSNQFDPAEAYFFQSLELFQSLGDSVGVSNVLSSLGEIYLEQQRFQLALQQFKRSLKIQQSLEFQEKIARDYHNIGLVYLALDSTSLARAQYFDPALIIRDELKDLEARAATLSSIGDTYMKEEDYNRALVHYSEALKNQAIVGDSNVSTLYNIGLARYYTEEYGDAIEVLESTLNLTYRFQLDTFRRSVYRLLSEVYTENEDETNALRYFQLYTGLNDSLFHIQKSIEIKRMRDRMMTITQEKELQAKEFQIVQSNNRNQRNEILLYAGGVLLILIIALVGILFRQTKIKQRVNDQLAFQNKVINTQNRQLHKINQRLEEAKRTSRSRFCRQVQFPGNDEP